MMNTKEYVLSRICETARPYLRRGDRLLLYGSRARGDEHEDSDWGLLVLLDKPRVLPEDYDGVCYALTSLGWDINEDLGPVLISRTQWDDPKQLTMFQKNVEEDGITLL